MNYYWRANQVEPLYTDKDIIDGCKARNRKVQEYLYRKYYNDFLKICMRYTDTIPDAEQCLNDGFYKIFTKTVQYDNGGSFEGWMKRIVINTCLDKLKASKTKRALNFVEMSEQTPGHVHITNGALQNLNFKEIIQSLQQLPETHRMVFNLSIFEGYSHKEIAKLLSIKEGTSYWYMNQARELLKKELSKYQLKCK